MAIVADGALKEILRHFPIKQCSYVFAYGSAVFLQKDQTPGKMLDLVFVVDDPIKWHTENLTMNRNHYSGLRRFGPKAITRIQERMACGVYYNPYCNVDNLTIKYGVISSASLEDDLRLWKHLYIAGRLHKPVLTLQSPTPALEEAMRKNHQTALRAVLLQEGIQMSKFDLYHGITELSYLGDTRMRFAENPKKTRNIVQPLINEFDRLYMPLVNETGIAKYTENGLVIQDTSPSVRFKLLMSLPNPLQISLAQQHCRDPRFFDIEEIMAELSYLPYLRLYIRTAISDVVRGASLLQTFQGILTAGVFKSIKYGLDKLKKRVQRKPSPPQELLPPPDVQQSEDKIRLIFQLKSPPFKKRGRMMSS
ncbi:Phosphatidate cytidylyltransferase, mitochondrial [Orchesella cincta]|uniref:Phosphatidate cytidylyltransferase, mitochondrial n=1 Tax=Orchesella cincta TaxID=48709 RepID=A0A1D2N8S1_ORCCI|nr:Phosphatidate cytidylyltransferase, mitochondrial [Orchesella cincta]